MRKRERGGEVGIERKGEREVAIERERLLLRESKREREVAIEREKERLLLREIEKLLLREQGSIVNYFLKGIKVLFII